MQLSTNLEARFWSKVDRSNGPDGCWPWTAAIDTPGYGAFKVDGKKHSSHRMAFSLSKGIVPKGADVCHSCDNRLCCNPNHLSLGTRKQNMDECVQRGRTLRGERNPQAKLSTEQVRVIKTGLRSGSSVGSLARRFGVNPKTITHIKTGATWKHVELPSQLDS